MQALFLKGKNKLIIEQVSLPILKEDEILIHVRVTGIGGSEYLGYNNPGIRSLPNIMGHGICGLTEQGKRVAIYPLIGCDDCEYCKINLAQLCTEWKMIGVHLNGGFAEQVAVSKTAIFQIPDTLSWEQASFIEPFANSVNAWEISKVNSKDNVLIIGAGGLGLGLVACANHDKHKSMYLLEKSKERRAAAIELGAKISDIEKNHFDIVFDTVGSHESRNEAIKSVKRNGKIVFLGFATAQQEINFSELIRMQYEFKGSFVYSKKQFSKAIKLAEYTNREWVKNLTFKDVELQLKRYLKDDFRVVKSALRVN